MSIQYLDLEQALLLIGKLGDLKVRDMGLLDSALHRPQTAFGGVEVYPTLALKAAALLHSLAKNHALFDGNKRTAWLLTTVFLRLNGHRPHLTHDEAFLLVMDVAASADIDLERIALDLRLAPVS